METLPLVESSKGDPPPPLYCARCGVFFFPYRDDQHCRACKKIINKKPKKIIPPRVCKHCNQEFSPNHHLHVYCTPKCRNRSKKQRFKPVRAPKFTNPRRELTNKYTDKELTWLEKRSFENMINFYQDDLRRIDAGEKPLEISPRMKSKLIERGAISRVKTNIGRVTQFRKLTPRARKMLHKIGENG